MINTQSRDKALLETIRQGLFLASAHNQGNPWRPLRYIGLSEISNNTEKGIHYGLLF